MCEIIHEFYSFLINKKHRLTLENALQMSHCQVNLNRVANDFNVLNSLSLQAFCLVDPNPELNAN